MSGRAISKGLRQQVIHRARSCCEYCQLPVALSFYAPEIDHVIPKKHGGTTTPENLALACWRCNRYKGSDLGSFDPQTGDFSFLYNPRTQKWTDHFQLLGHFEICGLSPEGRTTVQLLQFNTPERLRERECLRDRPDDTPT